MSNTLPVRIEFSGFPATFAPANIDQAFRAGVARMFLQSEQGYVLLTEGNSLPVLNIGPVILIGDDGQRRLYLWNDTLGRYMPSVPAAAGFRARVASTLNFDADNAWKQVDNLTNDDLNVNSVYDPFNCQIAVGADDVGYWQFAAQLPIAYVSGAVNTGTFNLRLRRIFGSGPSTETIVEGPITRLTGIGAGTSTVLTLTSPLVLASLNDNFDLQVRGDNGGNVWQMGNTPTLGWFSGWRVSQ